MKKKKMLFFGGSILTLAVSILTLNAIKNVDVSYAINVDSDGLPTESFKTNFNGTSSLNAVRDVLNQIPSSHSTGFKENFTTPYELRVKGDDSVVLYLLEKNKLVPGETEIFGHGFESGNPIRVGNKGLKALIKYGYSNNETAKCVFKDPTLINEYGKLTDSSDKQYMTQIAIWMYIYEHETDFADSYCANNGCQFYDRTDPENPILIPYSDVRAAVEQAGNKNSKIKYITKLVDLADNEQAGLVSPLYKFSNKLKNYTFNDDKNYILSGILQLTDVYEQNFADWSVSIVGQNKYNLSFVDENGDPLQSTSGLKSNQKVRVKIPIPASGIETMNLAGVQIHAVVNTYAQSGDIVSESYRVTEGGGDVVVGVNGTKMERYSNVYLGTVKTIPASDDFNLSNFTIIGKFDETGQHELGGAHLQVFHADDLNSDSTGPKEGAILIEEWDSVEGQDHRLYLQDGEYGLCETVYPTGYGFDVSGNTDPACITFTVNNGTVNVHQMINYPVPNTGLFKSKISYTIGGALIIIGILGMVVVLGNDKKKQQKKNEQEQQAV